MTKPIVRIICVLAAIFCQSYGALCQTAPPSDTILEARKLVASMQVGEQIKLILPDILRQAKQRVTRDRPDLDRAFDTFLPAVSKIIDAHLSEFLDDVAKTYARNFSSDEIRQLTNFYGTPLGQKLLQKMPDVTKDILVNSQKFAQTIGPEIQNRMTEELRKHGYNI